MNRMMRRRAVPASALWCVVSRHAQQLLKNAGPLVAHAAFMAVVAGLYVCRSQCRSSGLANVDPLAFLLMPVLFLINYVMITPLAMLTLITLEWETRSNEPAPANL